MTKKDCIQSLRASLASTAQWRLNIADKCPTDRRYARAAQRLEKLASEVPSLSDSQFAALEPHFKSNRWYEALRHVSRQIGFSIRKASLQFFVRCLVRALDEPTPA
jgi:hypothetical protein